MRHLKKYKIFGSSFMMKLSKDELDKLDESDVEEYRHEFIQRNNQESDFDQYMNEFELYCEIRFDYNRKFLNNLLDDHITKKTKDENDKASNLIFSIISKDGGVDMLNDINIKECRKKIGEPKYILGL